MTSDDKIEELMAQRLPELLDRLSTTTDEGVRNKVSSRVLHNCPMMKKGRLET